MSSPELEYFCHAKQTSDIHIKSVLFLILTKFLVETYVMLCYVIRYLPASLGSIFWRYTFG